MLSDGGQLTSKEMSFWLTRSGAEPTAEGSTTFGGVFTLGGTNSSLFTGDIEFLDLVGQPAFWALDMKRK
jgi:cathepsin D